MNPSAARFDATLRAELGSRWVRHALIACAAVTVIGSVGWLGGFSSTIWAPAVVAGSILVSAAVRSRFRDVTPRWVVFTAAAASLATSAIASLDTVEGTAGGVLLGGVTALAVFEPRRRALVLSVVLMSVEAASLWLAAPDWQTAVAFFPMAAAAGITVALLSSLRGYLAERGEAVVTGDLRYRDLFDRVPVGLYRTGLAGEVLDANQALADLLGAPRSAVIGRPIQRFFVEASDLSRLREQIPVDGTPLATDLRFRRADGSVFWVRDRTRAVRDETGAVRWFEGELQDITQQLEHVERLQAAIKSKSDLIAAVSHELRTPLTAVVGYLDLLAAGPIEHSGDMLAVAAEQAHEVAAIVDDLLTAARLDNRELLVNAEEVDVVGTVRSAVRSLGNPYVLMSLPLQLTAVGDAARIRQILRNLIGNAYRYGLPPVSVHAEASGGTVSIVVADRGDPIGAGVESQMFEPFFTTGVGESQPGAIGLGLAVSRQLARRMGGDLRHDRVGAETRFTLELPVSASEVEAA
jgi:PAS domain S-box-containing protein